MRSVHVVVPDGFDDPARPSGGNTYDRRICAGLAALGWVVHVRAVPGLWPTRGGSARAALAAVLAAVPDGGTVVVDGLIASAAPEVVVPESRRLRLVALVHLPLADRGTADGVAVRERAVLSAAAAVVTTSVWTRRWLLDEYRLRQPRLYVAEPGAEVGELAHGTASGGQLLCVAAVAPHKGHDVLLEALATLADLPWRCTCVGTLDRDRGFVECLDRRAIEWRIGDRLQFTGTRSGAELDLAYAGADVLVLASHAETYGMVVTEALGRGLPVIATHVGGLPEALGRAADGTLPGLLVPPADPKAFAAALRRWLCDAELRRRLRRAACARRATLPDWSETSRRISRVLAEVGA